MLMVILLSVSLSLDAFAVAVAHGLKSTRIPPVSKLIICLLSMLYFGVAMWMGGGIAHFFSPQTAKIIGIVLMSCICFGMLFGVLWNRNGDKADDKAEKKVLELNVKSIGITIQVIRNPMLSDLDHSHSISPVEALLLGTALSVDSISTGIGYSLLGSASILAPVFVGLFQFAFLYVGELVGKKATEFRNINTDYLQLVSIAVIFILIIVRIFG